MPGLGRADYPELLASEAFEIVEKVGRQSVKTASGLASVMGLKSADSGYFYHQVSSLTKYYGLIDRTKGTVALTPLGERIAHPLSDSDKVRAQAESVRRVGLLAALYERLGSEFHEADFKTTLRDVTSAPLADIDHGAADVEKLYRDASRFLAEAGTPRLGTSTDSKKPGQPGETRGDQLASPVPSSYPTHEAGFRTFQADGVYLKIKKDRESLEEALATIQGWLKRHQGEGTTKSSD